MYTHIFVHKDKKKQIGQGDKLIYSRTISDNRKFTFSQIIFCLKKYKSMSYITGLHLKLEDIFHAILILTFSYEGNVTQKEKHIT